MTTPTSVRAEYRLVWKRGEGEVCGPIRKVKRFQTLAAAERHIVRLTGPDVDPHYKCDHDSLYCIPMPPIIDGPHLQVRTVTPWEPAA